MSILLPDNDTCDKMRDAHTLRVFEEDQGLIFTGNVNSDELKFDVAGLPIVEFHGQTYDLGSIVCDGEYIDYYVKAIRNKLDIDESQR